MNKQKEVNRMKNKNLLVIILVIGMGVGGFFAGIKYQQNRQPSKVDFRVMKGMRKPAAQQRGGSVIKGEIISQDEKSITVKLPDGSSKIIWVLENTKINKTAEGSVDDLEVGKRVAVWGQENSDKSISASNIQLEGSFIRENKQN